MLARAYGLVVDSPVVPPWFAVVEPLGGVRPDVSVRVVDELPSRAHGSSRPFQRLGYPGLASATIEGGSNVSIRLDPGVDRHAVELLLTGPVMGVLLHQRGQLVLHASAARFDEVVAVFTGGSSWGKSTIAARLYLDGFVCVADDVVPLSGSAGRVMTVPGYPIHKLWPDAVSTLGLQAASMAPIGLEGEKRRMDASRGFSPDPLAVSRIYVLASGPDTHLDELAGHAAFVEIVRHSYLVEHLDSPTDRIVHLRQVEAMMASVKVRRLVQGPLPDIDRLPALIREDMADGSPIASG